MTDLTLVARGSSKRPVLSHVDLRVTRGDILGIVGESGSGKSTLALAMMGTVKPGLRATAGQVRVAGVDMLSANERTIRSVLGREIAHVPQNAGSALTPTKRVGALIDEVLSRHTALDGAGRRASALQHLSALNIANAGEIARRYPFELSGGQQQRCAIALALACDPSVLLLDEPTSGLDATAHRELLTLLLRLARERNLTIVCISHDMRVVARLSSRVAVMYAGLVVEQGVSTDVLGSPRHPYTAALIRSSPTFGAGGLPQAMPTKRAVTSSTAGSGCAFAQLCPSAIECCDTVDPPRTMLPGGAWILCHRPDKRPCTEASSAPPRHSLPGVSAEGGLALSAVDLVVRYSARNSWPSAPWMGWARARPAHGALEGVSLSARPGSILGVIGESGSGKSTLLKAVAGAVRSAAGRVTLDGHDLPPGLDARPLDLKRRIQLIWQNPMTALNPRQTVREALSAPLRLYFGLVKRRADERAAALLASVGLGPEHLERLPRQLSGGEAQRVAIARALAAEPDVLLCDEITSALDVSVQAAVLALIDDIRRRDRITIVFVSHDLAVVRAIADDVAVLRDGRLCEAGPASNVFEKPQHPHTRALIDAFAEDPPAAARTISARYCSVDLAS